MNTNTTTARFPLSVWGRTYETREDVDARLRSIAVDDLAYGPSDERVSEANALREALREVALREAREEARAAREAKPRYTGATVNNSKTGTTHFVNGWGETFCGRYASEIGVTVDYGYRATCGTCRAAGDAALRDGTESAGGSAARRH